MKPIDLGFLPADSGVTVKGEIFDSSDPVVLLEDLLEIGLPSGKTIDVGWYPEHDPNGSYRIVLYRDDISRRLRQRSERHPYDVLRIVEDWIGEDLQVLSRAREVTPVSASSEETLVYQYA